MPGDVAHGTLRSVAFSDCDEVGVCSCEADLAEVAERVRCTMVRTTSCSKWAAASGELARNPESAIALNRAARSTHSATWGMRGSRAVSKRIGVLGVSPSFARMASSTITVGTRMILAVAVAPQRAVTTCPGLTIVGENRTVRPSDVNTARPTWPMRTA